MFGGTRLTATPEYVLRRSYVALSITRKQHRGIISATNAQSVDHDVSIHDVLDVVLANLRANRKGPFYAWLRRAVVRVWRRSTRERVLSGTSRTTMTSTDGCTACSSIGTGNTPALISPRGPRRLNNQSERDALLVRGHLSEEDRDNGAAVKKAIEGVFSDLVFELQSEIAERGRARV